MHLSLLFLNPLISITDWDQGISKPKAYLLFYYMDNDWQEGDRLFFYKKFQVLNLKYDSQPNWTRCLFKDYVIHL